MMTKPGNTAVITDTGILQCKLFLNLEISFGFNLPIILLKTLHCKYNLQCNIIYNAMILGGKYNLPRNIGKTHTVSGNLVLLQSGILL